eukprot:2938721-Lingulodinium_polyedra.AAC.1
MHPVNDCSYAGAGGKPHGKRSARVQPTPPRSTMTERSWPVAETTNACPTRLGAHGTENSTAVTAHA